MRRFPALVLAGVAVLGAVGCSADGSTEEAVVESIKTSLLRDPTFDEYEISDEDASCVASKAVQEIGAARMTEIGATGTGTDTGTVDFADLTDDEIIALGDAMESCVTNIDDLLVDAIATEILADPDPQFPVSDDEAACVGRQMADQFSLSRMILLGVRGDGSGNPFSGLDPDEIGVFADAMVGCIDVRTILLGGIAASGAPDDALACLDANITDDDIRSLFTAAFAGQDSDAAAQEILGPAVEACT